jgi:hypothetical protein
VEARVNQASVRVIVIDYATTTTTVRWVEPVTYRANVAHTLFAESPLILVEKRAPLSEQRRRSKFALDAAVARGRVKSPALRFQRRGFQQMARLPNYRGKRTR